MKNCPQCMQQVADDTVICPNCGCEMSTETQQPANASQGPQVQVADKASIPLCIVAALIPIFGVIYWAVKHKTSPKKAKACGITGIIAWAVNFVLLMAQSGLF